MNPDIHATPLPHIPYVQRQRAFIAALKKKYPDVRDGLVLIFGAYEQVTHFFEQDGVFRYFANSQEPGSVLTIDFSEKSTLFVPNYDGKRDRWVARVVHPGKNNPAEHGVQEIQQLGDACSGIVYSPFAEEACYKNLLSHLSSAESIFVCTAAHEGLLLQRIMVDRMRVLMPKISEKLVDATAELATMRRKKNKEEIDLMHRAINITAMVHATVAGEIAPGMAERSLCAGITGFFIETGASLAFAPIVATGKNGAILHYTDYDAKLEKGELVVVDIGARFHGYCADITRTYPVSGSFSKRQRELYAVVLDVQQHIAEIARPGMWLSNKDKPSESLHHIALELFKERKLDQYFTHGIGHFLGIDVHDLGDSAVPLQEGDVITIEPGIYIPEENMGIRIEDDYWITSKGAICLSEDLPREIDDIEDLMREMKQ